MLEPIIRGIDSRLDQSAQLLIATWSVKTSMVLERMRRVHRVYTDDDCRVLFAKQHPPATYRVRLAAIDDPTSNPLRVQTFVASTGSTDKSPADVICTTMFIGHAVVQVWGGSGAGEVDLTTPGTAVSDAVMVWPPVAGHAPWPPRVRLLEHQVEQFCRQPIPGADVDGFLDGW